MEKEIIGVARKAIHEAITAELIGYNKPLSKFTNDVMMAHESEFKQLINEGVADILNSQDFKNAFNRKRNLGPCCPAHEAVINKREQ